MAIGHLTPKEEAFCRAYLRTGYGAAAYRAAYNVGEKTKANTVYTLASKLLAKGKIAARIREIMDGEADVTLGEIVNGFKVARQIAIEDRVPSAITGAVTALARVKGFLKDDAAKAGDIHIHFDESMRDLL